jgi:hypothetical protein
MISRIFFLDSHITTKCGRENEIQAKEEITFINKVFREHISYLLCVDSSHY